MCVDAVKVLDEKLDWEKIFKDLQNEFNSEEISFLEALSVVAQIKIQEASGEINEKEKVHKAIDILIDYVRKNKSANEKINNMFGFAEDKKSQIRSEKTWKEYLDELSKESVKEYLYFIADMKIKATVYLLRMHNFVKNGGLNNVYLTVERFIEIIKEIVSNENFYSNVYNFFSCKVLREKEIVDNHIESKNRIDNLSEKEQNAIDYIKKCKEFVSKSQDGWDKVKDIANELREMESAVMDKEEPVNRKENTLLPVFQQYDMIGEYKILADHKYYLFDNSMREIQFTGIGWNWLWKYEQSKADMFRCSDGTDTYDLQGDSAKTGREFYQFMIATIVRHMNKGKDKPKLASYSKNPFRDIYKYMSVKQQEGTYLYKVQKDENETYKANLYLRMGEKEIPLDDIETVENSANTVWFSIIRNGETNTIASVKDGSVGKGKSFSEFITNEEQDDSDMHYFCVDILNNTVPYRGDVRNVFGKYVSQFPDVDSKQLQSAIVAASDKEVVMWWDNSIPYRKIEWLTECPESLRYEDFEENVEYRIELTKKDVLGLFYSIWKNNRKKDAVSFGMNKIMENGSFSINQKDIRINCELVKEKQESADVVESSDTKTVLEAKEKKEKAIKEAIKHDILKRGETYLYDNWKIDVIQVFLREYKNKYETFGFGEMVYNEGAGDKFVNFCRKLFLQ